MNSPQTEPGASGSELLSEESLRLLACPWEAPRPQQLSLPWTVPLQIPTLKHIRSSYLIHLFDPAARQRTIEHLVKCIKTSGVRFNAVAFQGWSGALIAPELALKLNVGLVGVRKEYDREPAHGRKVEGHIETDLSYIIVDDFISSGKTISELIAAMEVQAKQFNEDGWLPVPVKYTCVGVFLWNSGEAENIKTLYKEGSKIFFSDEDHAVTLPLYYCRVIKL
jgi:hypothetical protein